jgi:hypothetical protein
MSAFVNIDPVPSVVQKLEARVSLGRRKETEMGVILTIALVVLVVAVALWFLRRA